MELTVVGMNYRVTPDTMRKMQESLPISCKLEREPENVTDENAIRVVLKEKPWRNMHIGYLPRAVASALAPRMDADKFPFNEAWLIELDDEAGKGEMRLFKRKIAS